MCFQLYLVSMLFSAPSLYAKVFTERCHITPPSECVCSWNIAALEGYYNRPEEDCYVFGDCRFLHSRRLSDQASGHVVLAELSSLWVEELVQMAKEARKDCRCTCSYNTYCG